MLLLLLLVVVGGVAGLRGSGLRLNPVTGGYEDIYVVVGEELQPLEQGSAGPTSVGLQAEDLSWGEMANVGK